VQLQDNYQRVLMVSHTTDVAGGLGTILQVSLNTTITNMAERGRVHHRARAALRDWHRCRPAAGALILLKFDLADATEP